MYITLGLGGLIIIILFLIFTWRFDQVEPRWGVTFSAHYAEVELGLDWQQTYLAILDDLQVDHIRLSAYWDEIEQTPGTYQFEDLDWQIAEAAQRQVDITLAVGRRLPRWPECHQPDWLSTNSNTAQEQQLSYVKAVAERYKNVSAITRWQVENEPFLGSFGECPPLNKDLLQKEITLVRQITNRPIMITDSGELSSWLPAGRSGANVLGSTLYRVVHNKFLGYWRWPLPSSYYWLKSQIIKKWTAVDEVIIAELQAEAWHQDNITLRQMTPAQNNDSLSLNQLKKNIEFARRTGLSEIYLWGAEWWYFLKVEKEQPDYWAVAQELWK